MNQVQNLQTLQNSINTGNPVLIYFSGQNCSVCFSLKPKIEEQVLKNFPKMEIYEVKADISKEIASKFSVFSIPTILVFFDSKEFFREGRNLSVGKFIEQVKRPYTLFMD